MAPGPTASSAASPALAPLVEWIRTLNPAVTPSPAMPVAPQVRSLAIGVDGSEPSNVALQAALSWAKRSGATVHAVHAVPQFPAPWSHGPSRSLDLQKLAEAEGRKVLDVALQQAGKEGVTVSPHVAQGDPARAVLGTAKRENVSLVVVGSHGFGPVNRFLLGSVSTGVVTHSDRSVLVVRGPNAGAPTRILLGVDGSERSVIAAAWAVRLADQFGAALTVVHVADLPASPVFGPADLEALTTWLHRVRAQFPRIEVGGKPVAVETTSGSPGARLAEIAGERGYDLLIVGSAVSPGAMGALVGSVARKVVHVAPCSVLVAI